MSLRHEFRRLLWRAGYDISRFTPEAHPVARMKQLLGSCEIDVVVDVGANCGQFGTVLRHDLGYTKRIISFEPLTSAFAVLEAKADNDPQWEVMKMALGDADELSGINIAGNSQSSSLLGMLPAHLAADPDSAYRGKEDVRVKRLDSIFGGLWNQGDGVLMKIDTQGYEDRVLKGAEEAMQRIDTVQMEMSLVPMYEGEVLFCDLHRIMESKGYSLVSLSPVLSDPSSGSLLQIDGIFHRLKH
jgi:FkbM family methyltransferase